MQTGRDTTRRITLAIETSNPGASADGAPGEVGLGEVVFDEAGALIGARFLDSEALRPSASRDDALMPAIDRLCRRVGVGPAGLSRVAVSVGPGGFTSVRVAVAAAKCIGEATGCQCVRVPSAEVAVRGAMACGGVEFPAAVALASKRGTAWVALFAPPRVEEGTGLPRWAAEPVGRVMDAAGLDALRVDGRMSTLIADAHLPDAMREWAARTGARIVAPAFSARACFEASVGRAAADALALAPIYPREPEAVTKWRERAAESRAPRTKKARP